MRSTYFARGCWEVEKSLRSHAKWREGSREWYEQENQHSYYCQVNFYVKRTLMLIRIRNLTKLNTADLSRFVTITNSGCIDIGLALPSYVEKKRNYLGSWPWFFRYFYSQTNRSYCPNFGISGKNEIGAIRIWSGRRWSLAVVSSLHTRCCHVWKFSRYYCSGKFFVNSKNYKLLQYWGRLYQRRLA